LKLIVEYDGTDFRGFQSQGQGNRTVQSVLAEAIQPIIGQDHLTIHAAGRTDTGVHAVGQVISFATASQLPIERWAIALNSRLPRDVAVASAEEAPDDFHARFSARSRTYRYAIWTRRTRSALWDRYSLHVRHPLNLAEMREAARSLVGVHDFAAYKRAGGNPGPTTVRNLQRLSIHRLPSGLILVTVTANAFLRSMVRNIIGVLIEIGKGDLPPAAAQEILATRERIQNPCAPAAPHGLCLWRVEY
jgi:tRNA pseudouridine38-40 synthase